MIQEMAGLIVSNDGQVTVAGHTDNVPISTDRFRSNWDLSTARAVSVAHELLENAPLDEARFVVIGHADTRPLAPNDTVENRARNRRVDISIVRGDSIEVEQDRPVEAVAASESEGAEPNE